MRAVLYAHDMEPITVIELQPWAWEFLRDQGQVRLAVHRRTDTQVFNPDADNAPISRMNDWIVTITAELLVRGSHRCLMLFTQDEEAALLLKSDLLPGQHRDAQSRDRVAFAKGFLGALNMLGKS